ncbi:MAG: hypothetical protein QOE84_1612 [Actinomycetota bacterium]|nr:hypothetical protein [Actinomycetota bacterium]
MLVRRLSDNRTEWSISLSVHRAADPLSTGGARPAVDRRWSAWFLSRMTAIAFGGLAIALVRGNVFYDTVYYAHWAHGTLTGARVPYRDFAWEYPPGVLPAMLVPGIFAPLLQDGHGSLYVFVYGALWVLLMLAVDALVLRWLLRLTHAEPGHPATRLWLWGLPLLGALTWARFDLLPAAAASVAMLAAATGTYRRAGTWGGVGAALKLWPALLAPVQRSRSSALKAVARTAAVVGGTAALTLALTGSTGYGQVLSYQSRRGLQCESLAALPFLWIRHLAGTGYRMRLRFGAWEVVGPHIGLICAAATGVYTVGLIGLAVIHWRFLRRDVGPELIALSAVALALLTLCTDKVLSPQYLLWLLAIMAAAAVVDAATWGPYVPWTALACALSAVVFPWFYGDVLQTGWLGLLALTARDLVLLGMAVAVARRLVHQLRVDARGHRVRSS